MAATPEGVRRRAFHGPVDNPGRPADWGPARFHGRSGKKPHGATACCSEDTTEKKALMTTLLSERLAELERLLAKGASSAEALPGAIGGSFISGGIWRFFSDSWPEHGISYWNTASAWKQHWQPFLPDGVFSFGEDIFGNQLVLVGNFANVMLWNHENGEFHDLLVGPCELLKTVAASGIDWIDHYSDGSLSVARQCGAVPLEMHLHWTTPLILGGQVSMDNVSVAPREPHLVGHAKLWQQIADLPPGTTPVPR